MTRLLRRGHCQRTVGHPMLQLVMTLVVFSMTLPTVWSANVMFILRDEANMTEGDEAQIAIFEARGDTLDLWDNNRLQNDFDALDVADEADLVYIDESVTSSRADPVIETITPVLNNEPFAFDNWFMAENPIEQGSPDGVKQGGTSFGSRIQIVDEAHPIIQRAGLANGVVQIYDEVGGRIDWGTPGDQADIVAILPGIDDASTIFVYEKDAELVDGSPATGMRIGFFLSDTNRGPERPDEADGTGPGWEATLLTDAGKNLLSAAIDYALGITEDRATQLQAGDTDMDLDFDQLDLVQVSIAAKYLTGAVATWGEGDWDGAPGGEQGSPPAGNGLFDQLDIITALAPGHYLAGPYAAIQTGGQVGDAQTSVIYDAGTGEVQVDAPGGVELTSINIDSAAGIFTASAAENLGGSFDNDADGNVFKATFGGSFGSVSFGNVAQAGLSEAFVLDDLSVVGSLSGGGDLGEVDLVYVPEPTSAVLLALGLVVGILQVRRGNH